MLLITWQPNFDRVPVPVLSSFGMPFDMISSTNLRYLYSSCFSKIMLGKKENVLTSSWEESKQLSGILILV